MGLLDWLTGNKARDPTIPRQSAAQLIEALLALNDDRRLWSIRDARGEVPSARTETLEGLGLSHRPDLVAGWKTDDARTRQALLDAGISPQFTVLLRLDDAKSTVRSVDHDSGSTSSPSGRTTSFGGFRGQATMSGFSASYKRDADGDWVTSSEGAMSTNDIKQPLRDAVARCGWGWHGVAIGRF